MKIGFIGFGNMSQAIVEGWIQSQHFDISSIYVTRRNMDILNEQAIHYGFHAIVGNQALIDAVDIVFLGVKPEDLASLNIDLKGKKLVSMAAKTSIDTLVSYFNVDDIVRIMPNLNVAINQGTCAITHLNADTSFVSWVVEAMNLLGTSYVIKESQMSGYIALAGSSPALIYRFIDALAQAAIAEGFDKGEALDIVAQTMIGSASYLKQSPLSPSELIAKVASKGGTTQAGLDVMTEMNFDDVILQTAKAIIDKDKQG